MMTKFKRKHLSIPYSIFIVLFIILPLILVFFYAITDEVGNVSLTNFSMFFSSSESISALVYSIYIALLTTVICLIIAYPVAYILSNPNLNRSKVIIVLFILPMWMNFLLRTLAIREMFFFLDLHLGEATTLVGMVYNFLPFMILPIYTTIINIDKSIIEAAYDLGATNLEVIQRIIIPLSKPGISSGILMVFMPTISTFVISDLLSVGRIQLLGNLINLNFTTGNNWNYGSAISFILLILIGLSMIFTSKGKRNVHGGNNLW